MRVVVCLAFSASFAPLAAHAQLIAYDGFEEYTAGVQFEDGANGSPGVGLDGGFGWGGAYDVSNAFKSKVLAENRSASPVSYSNGEISIDGGVRALRVYDNTNGTYLVSRSLSLGLTTVEPVYFSFLFRTNNASPLPAQDFFQVGLDDGTSANPRASIGANTLLPTGTQPFRFFARTTTGAGNSTFDNSTDILAATTYLLVGHVSGTATNFDQVDLFVNPSTLAEPSPSATFTLDSGVASLDHLIIRTASLDNGDAYVIDELRVGYDYVSVIPEQSSAALLLGGISILASRRKRSAKEK